MSDAADFKPKKKRPARQDSQKRSAWPWIALAFSLFLAMAGVVGLIIWTIIATHAPARTDDIAAASKPVDTASGFAFGTPPATNPFQAPPATTPFQSVPASPFAPPANPFQPPMTNPPPTPFAPNPPPPAANPGATAILGASIIGPKESFAVAIQNAEPLMQNFNRPSTPKAGKVTTLAISPDGRTLLAGGTVPPRDLGFIGPTGQTSSGILTGWDVGSWKQVAVFPKDYRPPVVEGDAGIHRVTFVGDSRHALCLIGSGDALLCDLTLAQKPKAFKMRSPSIYRVLQCDLRRALIDGDDDSFLLWDLEKQQDLQQFIGHAQHPSTLAFLPDGKRILSTSHDGTLRLWDAKTGQQLRRHDLDSQSPNFALLPKGRHALLAGRANLVLWDIEGWQEERQMRAPIAMLADAKSFTEGEARGERAMLNANRYPASIRHMACTPDGKRALFACFDKSIRLWDLEKDQELCVFLGHTGMVECLVVLPDGQQFVTGGDDGYVRVWDIPSDEALARLPSVEPLDAIAPPEYRPAERPLRRLYTGGAGFVYAAAFGKDGRRAVTCSDLIGGAKTAFTRETLFRIWDVEHVGEVRRSHAASDTVTCLTISPDGKRALSGCGDTPSRDSAVHVWDLETGKVVGQLTGHSTGVGCVAYSADGKRAASGPGHVVGNVGNRDFSIIIWNAGGGEQRRLIGHQGPVNSVAFSPDGKYVVSAAGRVDRQGKPLPANPPDNSLRLWDAGTGRELRRFEGHADPVLCAVFSPDGRKVLGGGADKTMRLWDVQTGKELRQFGGHKGVVMRVAFSPDGKRAVSGGGANDGFVRLWDVETGQELGQFRANITGVMALAFAPDGRDVLIAAGFDLLVWRTE